MTAFKNFCVCEVISLPVYASRKAAWPSVGVFGALSSPRAGGGGGGGFGR